MQKKIKFSNTAFSSTIAGAPIRRYLPSSLTEAVGPFILLDQAGPFKIANTETRGVGPHPHRGIATLTYAVSGEIEHLDSLGNRALVSSGGVQWMNAGNGIVHDERSKPDGDLTEKEKYAFQFWINLPSKIKTMKPEYIPMQAAQVPVKNMPEGAGLIRVLVGSYQNMTSKIPTYSQQFLYHLALNPGQKFKIDFLAKTEVAAVLPTASAVINAENFSGGKIIVFDEDAGEIEMENRSDTVLDILLFGGEKYTEPIVAQGPFVMNSEEEIALAYEEYTQGKYGEIQYPTNG
ncbi:pirin family protein [Cyclobacterium marinum]|uniref:pirin family protein n=1 Tax=Cyclobacterium marinum TaxID=104 RepID=UPI0011EBEEFC|nr:pirin family protein [Cyclobacterium marinum]MBI0400756.1 pirin family protein [Cyclobacterium marinum]